VVVVEFKVVIILKALKQSTKHFDHIKKSYRSRFEAGTNLKQVRSVNA
jgi:hypothetical protein